MSLNLKLSSKQIRGLALTIKANAKGHRNEKKIIEDAQKIATFAEEMESLL